MFHPTLVDRICWGTFVVVWFVGAAYNMSRGPAVDKRPNDWLVGWAAGGLVILLVLRYVPSGVWASLSVQSPWLTLAGSALLVASTAFILWSRYVLGRMWSSAPLLKDGHALRTTGPYAITRHPIYTGLIGMAAGTALEHGLGIMLAGVVVFVLLLQFKIRIEERLLTERFGDEYREYKRTVPGLIPGLKWR